MVNDLDEILPKKVKIGYSYHPIEIQDDKWMSENDATGDSNTDTKVINICDSWDLPTVMDTLSHETDHQLWSFFGINEVLKSILRMAIAQGESADIDAIIGDIEETVIRTLNTGRVMVFNDNPELKKVFYG